LDALDPNLFAPVAAPRTGDQFAVSQVANLSYKRLARTISVAAGGADLSFWISRDTETNWDFTFVEAHTAGQDDWTTLPDLNGHTGTDTGFVCPFWLSLHPFLEHYQTDNGDGTCSPSGTTGDWSVVSGASSRAEQWAVDLSAYAGKKCRGIDHLRERRHRAGRGRVRRRRCRLDWRGYDLVRGRRRHA
jgi:hypothetical protein